MSKLDIAKGTTKLVVGSSVSFTVARVLSANAPVTSRFQRTEVVIASVALGMLVAEKMDDWTDAKLDAVSTWWTDNIKNSK